ncbi:zinc knuckle CX2CX4HX4C containing protein, partial [Tanacetum coccineum]
MMIMLRGISGTPNDIKEMPTDNRSGVNAGPNFTTPIQNGSAIKNGGEKVGNDHANESPSSYTSKLIPTSSTKFASIEGVESVLRNGPWMIHGVPIFLNKWSPSVSLLKEELSHVPLWVMFHDVPLVTYTSDVSYARIPIEISACNDFIDHSAMVVPNLEGNSYTKETIRIEYEWKPPRCSTCLIFGHSHVNCPKAPKDAPTRV